MERVTVNLDALSNADREVILNRAENEGREVSEILLDLIKAELRGGVHNVNTGHVSGPSIQTGRIDGDLRF